MGEGVDRKDLLAKLLAVETGATASDTARQSACVVLMNGWAYTLNQELACAAPTGLDKSLTCAVGAKTLTDLLRRYPDERVALHRQGECLVVEGAADRTRLSVEPEIVLPVGRVDRPEAWSPLPREFGEAAGLVCKCTRRKSEFQNECVHLCPGWLEACDNSRMARYELKLPLDHPVLVRGTTLLSLIPWGFTQVAETERWLHFRNRTGLRMSARKWPPEDYADLSEFLRLGGVRVELPRGVGQAAHLAQTVADKTVEGELVTVRLDGSELTVRGAGATGEHSSRRRADRKGAPVEFQVPARMLTELNEEQLTLELTDVSLRFRRGPYTFVVSVVRNREN